MNDNFVMMSVRPKTREMFRSIAKKRRDKICEVVHDAALREAAIFLPTNNTSVSDRDEHFSDIDEGKGK